MLDLRAVASILGILVFFLGVALLAPVTVALVYGEAVWTAFASVSGGCMIGGGAVWWTLYRPVELQVREGFLIVALSWFVLSFLGALPFTASGALGSYTNAFFETVSGFTTTGATILGATGTPSIEALPHALLFWRSLAHWMGGMGIIVLTLAILPLLGIGGMQLFKAEVPGPSADKLTPRIQETAKRLWFIYVGITAAEVLLLLPSMGLFDAVNHAFATMATGGFSPYGESVGHFDSAYVDWVVTAFMYLAGINFALHYRMLRGESLRVLRSTEFRVYTGILLTGTALVTVAVWTPLSPAAAVETAAGGGSGNLTYDSLIESIRYAAFQVTSIVTTTGFGTADYELWPALGMTVLFALFFCGGMAGSTGGGIKVVRHVLLAKDSLREMYRLIHPQAIIPLRLDGDVVDADIIRHVFSFFVLFLATVAAGALILSFMGIDLLSALAAALSCTANIGPAFGTFGPTENYAHVPVAGKWVLSFLMVAGRLELFTLFLLFVPGFWRR